MNYKAAIVDITNVYQGGNFYRKYKYTTTLDFTGRHFKAQVRSSAGEDDVLLEFDSDDAATMIVDETEKTIELMAPGAQLADMRGSVYVYDIRTDVDGADLIYLQRGKVDCTDTVTR